MKTDYEMLRRWLEVWAEECRPGAARHDSRHGVWRLYWRFCIHHERAPLLLDRWLAACAVLTNGAVREGLNREGMTRLLSEARETVHKALRTGKKKAAHRNRRTVAR